MTKRRWGWRPQPHDERDVHFGSQHARVASIPDSYSLPHVAVRDQVFTSSCVGQGVSNAVRVATLARGRDCPPLSALAPYSWGRALEGGGAERRDDGSIIRNVIKAVQKLGIPSEETWPFDPAKVNDHPDGTALWDAHDRGGVRGYYAIRVPTGLAIRHAVASGYPVVAGWQLGSKFEEYDGQGLLDASALGDLGGHCMMIAGYTPGTFVLLNSWGVEWGRAGYATVTDSFVEAANDVWAVDVGDRP